MRLCRHAGDASGAAAVQELLLGSIQHQQDAVRAAALNWAVKLFPFDDVTARYLCILTAADARCAGQRAEGRGRCLS